MRNIVGERKKQSERQNVVPLNKTYHDYNSCTGQSIPKLCIYRLAFIESRNTPTSFLSPTGYVIINPSICVLWQYCKLQYSSTTDAYMMVFGALKSNNMQGIRWLSGKSLVTEPVGCGFDT
jgi:hypothetical protein